MKPKGPSSTIRLKGDVIMNKSTLALIQALEDSVLTSGFTQNISLIIQHKITDKDKVEVIHDLDLILAEPVALQQSL
jgi:hypothetical protein